VCARRFRREGFCFLPHSCHDCLSTCRRCNQFKRLVGFQNLAAKSPIAVNGAVMANTNLKWTLFTHPQVACRPREVRATDYFSSRCHKPRPCFCETQWNTGSGAALNIGYEWTLRARATSTCNIDTEYAFSTNGGMLRVTVPANANNVVRFSIVLHIVLVCCHCLRGCLAPTRNTSPANESDCGYRLVLASIARW